ncbi:MAG: glycosyltransferase family 2 protein [Candidatus Taylorbacteria bacterium]|nr:glycosyltransferase family 2 protein [Candidatus Taylorbacteria bacterium]
MKIIALMPVKNVAWILKTSIPQLKKFSDEILCLDGNSEDNTVEILKSYGAKIRSQSSNEANYSKWRNELLKWGRELGGTHFVWLDADEAFTTNFLCNFKQTLSLMAPGEKLALEWLCLWKSSYVYRTDQSIWKHLYKDFVFCDDKISGFGDTKLHEGRTPGPNENTWKKIPLEKGAVLHFQFVPFEKFQIKQAFQRCRELALGSTNARRINNKYSPTLDSNTVQTEKIPEEWLGGIENIDNLSNLNEIYYKEDIMKYFEEKGILFFEPLEIWHVPGFRKMFIEKVGREPTVKRYPRLLIKLNDIKNKLKLLKFK